MPLPSSMKLRGMIMCKKRRDFFKIAILVSFLVSFIPFSSFALVDSAEVSFNPDTSYITVSGGTVKKFYVDIVVDENAHGLTQCNIYLRCNKNVLAVDSVFIGSIWEGTGGSILLPTVDIDPIDSNRVYISYTLGGGDAWANGPGVLARVRFRTRATGESDLIFPPHPDSVILSDTLAYGGIPSKAINGMVYVQEGSAVENGTDEMKVIPGYSLSQNYPNPFNPETDISFSLPEKTEASLVIYNMLGEKIKTLMTGYMRTGTHTIHWNGRDEAGNSVASGIYFYRLKTGGFVETKKMVLMK
jgi:hypothetical protein